MSFLVPSAIVGLVLLAIPIIVHLLRPRRMRPTPFSSLRWLRETPQRASRRIQWHQWPLFLLRAGIITLLVAALAKPLLDFSHDRAGIDRVVVLDISNSMGRGAGGEPMPLTRAKELVQKIAANNQPTDRLSILAIGATQRIVLPATRGPVLQVAGLTSIAPDGASANLAAALPLVQMLLDAEESDRPREVIFVTDNLQNRWNQGDIAVFAAKQGSQLGVQIIDVSPMQRTNAWIAEARPATLRDGFETSLRVVVRSVGDANAPRKLRWTAGNGVAKEFSVSPFNKGFCVTQIPLPSSNKAAHDMGELRLEPPDEMPADDVYYVSLAPRPMLRALIVEPETGISGRRSGTHWREALAALSHAGPQIEINERTRDKISAGDVQNADFIVLAGVAELGDVVVDKLEQRVRSGAGLVVCLGPSVRFDFYNRQMHRPLQPGEGLLPVALADRPELARSDAPTMLTRLNWQHPLMAPLADPVQSDFASSQFLHSSNIVGEIGPQDAVLAWFDNGSPAILEHPLGAGRVLLLNTSADDAWTDLPRRKCFVPFVDRVVAYLAPGDRLGDLQAGQAFNLALPSNVPAEQVTVVSTSGEALHVDNPATPGVYRLEMQGKTVASVAVQGDRSDSALIASDAEVLRQWWSPANCEIASADVSRENATQHSAWPIWPWMVLAAGVLLVAEQLYVTRLCPRAAPKSPELMVRVRSAETRSS